MFSSLPSASKIYVGSTTKSRVKSSASNKRRRKKPNTQNKNESYLDYEVKNKETETLVSSTKSSDLYSVVRNEEIDDFDHSSSGNETSFSEIRSEIKSAGEPANYSEEKNACIDGGENKSHEMKHISDLDYCDDIFQTQKTTLESPFQEDKKVAKIIISEDNNINGFSANSEKKVIHDFQPSSVDFASQTDSCIANDSDRELKALCNDSINNHNEAHMQEIEPTSAFLEENRAIKNLQLMQNQKDTSENQEQKIREGSHDNNCENKHLNENEENSEEVSPRSDCCESTNIFDERDVTITEDNDIVDSNYFSNCKQDSIEEEEIPVNKTRSCSPETSEISCTESNKFESQNIVLFNKNSDLAISSENKSQDIEIQPSLNISNVKESIDSGIGYQQSEQTTELLSHCLEKNEDKCRSMSRSFSLPCLKSFKFVHSLFHGDKLSNPQLPSQINTFSNSTDSNNSVLCCSNCKTLAEQNDIIKCDENSEDNIMINKCTNSVQSLDVKQARLRSYVVGNIGATGSLIGAGELLRVFPEKRVTFFIGTWNMNEHDPPSNIDDFLLPLTISSMPDIYVIGVQECMQSRSEWEVLMQTTLGPSHVLFTSTSLGVLHLSIFLRRDLIWYCSEPEEANVTTRPGSMVKTKGAVAVAFTIFGTSFLFINSHLTAHEKNLKERFSDYEKICSSLDLPKTIPLKFHYRSKDVTSRFDNVFWNGDLNFRVVQDRGSVLSFVEEKIRKSVDSCSFLLKHDQLQKAMNDGVVFHGFQEGPIDFIPSYKFDVGTSTFDSAKQRVPSYTDRILYRSKMKDSVNCVHYNAVPEISTSDHKPVFAIFEVVIKPGRDNIPLAAGLFKRDVYLEVSRKSLSMLSFLFDFTATQALDLVERRCITHISSPSGRELFQVEGSTRKFHICLKNSNYCTCSAFAFHVWKTGHYMCKHRLAVLLSISMGMFQEVQHTDEAIALMMLE